MQDCYYRIVESGNVSRLIGQFLAKGGCQESRATKSDVDAIGVETGNVMVVMRKGKGMTKGKQRK